MKASQLEYLVKEAKLTCHESPELSYYSIYIARKYLNMTAIEKYNLTIGLPQSQWGK